jgi:DNA (cytosine-5)-methyltransferase 1
MAAYYNEFDPFAASWLKELIKDGLIADGVVDDRSITEVSPSDLNEFTQCHFFAGIGGWSVALRLAGWPDNKPVWTGSPPCQPFSVAGKQTGKDDERHLWPVFFNLIKEQAPPTVFGEQVASAIRHGWFDDLQEDLEKQNYASAMAVLPACSVGAPHKRERLWFVANSIYQGSQRGLYRRADEEREAINGHPRCDSTTILLADSEHDGCDRQKFNQAESSCDEQNVGLSDRGYSSSERESTGGSTFWDGATGTYCRDDKYRPIPTEPALFPLADGIPNRVGILRGAGNAIVPQVGAEVIKAFMFSEDES